MAALAAKDSYIQNLVKRVCAPNTQEPRKKTSAFRSLGSEEPKKLKKKKKPRKRAGSERLAPNLLLAVNGGSRSAAQGKSKGLPDVTGRGMDTSSFYAVDILRKRLHERIEESRGQGSSKGLSQEERVKKRQRRKQERDRKKRKRKELKRKENQAEEGGIPATETMPPVPVAKVAADTCTMVFNKVVVPEEEMSKGPQQKKEKKKQRLKGNLTPLTGKNYKQLLERLEARKNKLEELQEKDEKKARVLETKMKWTNVLYKAEGIKIKDNEVLLKASLKRKEKIKLQRKKQWEKRTEHTSSKMQQRQDKRRRNIQKRNKAKIEKKKDRARKKGRVLPEDLKKANLK
ncbi:surfeit locus protein 6 [Ambystoma mexicanum]|uniref:surfeit locus protein 6 n=1 Tax=Ambystoma mexicanum TaxID=8296 RepID=UPI0037E88738